MNRYLVPLAALGAFAGAVIVGAAYLHGQAEARTAAAARAGMELAESRGRLGELALGLAERASRFTPTGRFLAAWDPLLSASRKTDPLESVRARLHQEAARLPVAVSAWTTPPAAEQVVGEQRRKVQPCSLRVAGDLPLVLNWLGRAEEALPAARVSHAELTPFGGGVALDIRFLLPLEDPPSPTSARTTTP